MRQTAEAHLERYPRFRSTDGRAEATTLANRSVDLIVAGQSFHWFRIDRAREEFRRISNPPAFTVLVWNQRKTQSTGFLRAYEEFLLRHGHRLRPGSPPEHRPGPTAGFLRFASISQDDSGQLAGFRPGGSHRPHPLLLLRAAGGTPRSPAPDAGAGPDIRGVAGRRKDRLPIRYAGLCRQAASSPAVTRPAQGESPRVYNVSGHGAWRRPGITQWCPMPSQSSRPC